jgi:uncharacterized membrane protein
MHRLKETKIEMDLLLINALSLLLILSILLVPDSPVRTALGIPFALFFPGYALIGALFPGKNGLGKIERLALSIGLSLAIVPLVGFALNYTSWGIRLYPIITSLFILTLLLSIVSNYRRSKLPTEQKLNLAIPVKIPKWNAMQKTDRIFVVIFLVSIIAVGGLTAYLVSGPKISERFTEFYILGSTGKMTNYPVNLTLGENGTVTLGVVNHESENATYQIVITLDNITIGTLNNITLSNEMTWAQNYTFTPQKASEKTNLGFQLYREGLDEPYRSLQLWITVRAKE